MSDWNAVPPRGGPMVVVKGFPGPLYPPDHPKGPSPDGDFAVALKRTLGRLGAWPWDPGGWDTSYSNRFAHGDGWDDATHAGIAGAQHWSGTLDPTGATGEKTFNFLRSVRVGQGRTHAGEMAMDSVAVNLINSVYAEANEDPSLTVREAALARATTQIGQKESPPESNFTPYGEWYGEQGVPWCAIFATWCYEHGAKDAGHGDSPSFQRLAGGGGADRYDYVPYIVSDARNGRYGLSVTSSPKAGDLVCYEWGGNPNGEYDHVGLFKQGSASSFEAVEGNTSTGNNSNGGAVMLRERSSSQAAIVFVRVAEP